MASEVEICSNALRMLGAHPIINLTDQSVEARLCNGLYATTRDDLTTQHPWNFCVKRVALAQLLVPPAFDYSVQYELPSDCLGIIEVFPAGPYKIEGRTLVAYSGGMKARYKSRVEDTSLFPSYFTATLEYYLAAKLAFPIARQQSLERLKYDEYLTKLQEARVLNDHEHTPDILTPDILTRIRLGGG